MGTWSLGIDPATAGLWSRSATADPGPAGYKASLATAF